MTVERVLSHGYRRTHPTEPHNFGTGRAYQFLQRQTGTSQGAAFAAPLGAVDVRSYSTVQGAIDAAGVNGTVYFAPGTYTISTGLKFYGGQRWIGGAGPQLLTGQPRIVFTGASGSVVAPATPAADTVNFTFDGISINMGTGGDVGLDLTRTSYSYIKPGFITGSKAGAFGILLDAVVSGQCYFNTLMQPKVDMTNGAGMVLTRGANANQVFGGKLGNSQSGMVITQSSIGNLAIGTDFENNASQHVNIVSGSGRNVFYGCHMEIAPIGFNIASGCNYNRIDGTSYASTVTNPIADASLTSIVHEVYVGDIAAMHTGFLRMRMTPFSTGTNFFIDPMTVTGSANAYVDVFKNVVTSGIRGLRLYKDSTTVGAEMNANGDFTSYVAGKGLVLKNAAGTLTKRVRLNDAGNGLIFEDVP